MLGQLSEVHKLCGFYNLQKNLSILPKSTIFQDLRVDQVKKPCIRVNIRKLDRELCTELSILYTSRLLVHATVLLTYLKDYMLF